MPNDINIQLLYALNGFAVTHTWGGHLAIFFADLFPKIIALVAALYVLLYDRSFAMYRVSIRSTFVLLRQRLPQLFVVVTATIGAWAVATMIKMTFAVPRPFVVFDDIHALVTETGYALPSVHAATFMGLAVVVGAYHRRAGFWFAGAALIIGIARVAVGVHYPLDVFMGCIIGGIAAGAIARFVRTLLAKKGST